MLSYKGHVLGALLFLILAAASTLIIPLAIRRMLESGFSTKNAQFIDSYFMVMIAVSAVLAISSASRYYFVTWLGEKIIADLRRDVFVHITTLSASFFDTAKTGELVSRLTADTTQIKSAAGTTASIALRNILLMIGSIWGMVYTSPHLSGLVLIAIPVIVLPLFAFGRLVRKRSRLAQDSLAHATAYASESISYVRTLQSFSNEKMVSNRFSETLEHSFSAARKSFLARSVLTAFSIFSIFSSIIVVLWIGANAVLDQTLSAGALGQFLLYSVFAAGSMGALSEVWGELNQITGAAERLSELLTTPSDITIPAAPIPLPFPPLGHLRFDNVSFSYPNRSGHRIIDGLTFSVSSGETLALVGSSGSGKSTVFALALRYYDATSGSVLVDEVPVNAAAPEEVRNRIGLVPQDTALFTMSVADNIRFGRPDASDEEVQQAANLALAHEFIIGMEKGYQTIIGERGIMLSGGQRQRIAIARAILKNSPILLLDEATSALDAESESLVQKALDELMMDRATIVIAHRLSTVLKADRILVMDKGRIVEEGTHDTLLKQGGIYAGLAKLQFCL
ncbi:ABC transporter transmembrane domain-containing protein [Candidatus Endowatersipora endosymbiont of Watersipora subatra]|uniref:ABC transporter transmembrane domain-containing protein n=1 Tax=Candidatus Endowatersipora endosymbiont of Watersipora subatra TaxID=3077946 RepID=UPI00312C9378